jgi:hypothetical protein
VDVGHCTVVCVAMVSAAFPQFVMACYVPVFRGNDTETCSKFWSVSGMTCASRNIQVRDLIVDTTLGRMQPA